MTRGRAGSLLALALAAGCVGLDFVEPSHRSTAGFYGQLELDPTGTAWLHVDAQLIPAGDGAAATALPDSALVVGGARLAPSEVSGRKGYLWHDSLPMSGPRLLDVEPPGVPGVAAPPRLRVALRAGAPANAVGGWSPGTDLSLPLPPAPGYADEPASWGWTLDVVGWTKADQETGLVSVRSWADPGDTLRVPAALFPTVAVDSIEARWTCSTTYRYAASDSTYVATLSVRQTLVWRLLVLAPAPDRRAASAGRAGS